MGRCPSCGASSIFGIYTKKCAYCGKVVCNRCVPNWHGSFSIKLYMETPPRPAGYETVGFCSDNCYHEFWQKVLDYPMDYQIGTDNENFTHNVIKLWNYSIFNTLATGNPNVDKNLVSKASYAVQIHSKQFAAFPWWQPSGAPLLVFERFLKKQR